MITSARQRADDTSSRLRSGDRLAVLAGAVLLLAALSLVGVSVLHAM